MELGVISKTLKMDIDITKAVAKWEMIGDKKEGFHDRALRHS